MSSPAEAMFDRVEWKELPPPEQMQDELPYATHHGFLTIFGKTLECYTLSTGQRIFTRESLNDFFGGDVL